MTQLMYDIKNDQLAVTFRENMSYSGTITDLLKIADFLDK